VRSHNICDVGDHSVTPDAERWTALAHTCRLPSQGAMTRHDKTCNIEAFYVILTPDINNQTYLLTRYVCWLNAVSSDGRVTESRTAITSAAVTPTSRPGIQLCHNATVDAATAFNSTTYFFRGLFSSV